MSTIVIRPHMLPGYADCERRAVSKAMPNLIEAAGFRLNEDRRTAGGVIGSAVHLQAEYTLRHKIEHGTLGNDREAEQRAVQFLDEEAKLGVAWDETSPNQYDAQRQVQRMTHSYRRFLAPQLKPFLVETRLEARFNDRIIVSGQTDLLTAEPGNVRDLKTGVQSRANQAQLGSYILLSRSHGHKPERALEDWIKRNRLSKDQDPPVTFVYDVGVAERSAYAVLTRMDQAFAEFKHRLQVGHAPPEDAFLANPASNLCSAKWCPAHGTRFCREWKPK